MPDEIKTILIVIAAVAVGLTVLLITMLAFWGISYKVHPQNRIHMTKALETLKGNWTIPVLSVLIFSSVSSVFQVVGQVISGILEVLVEAGTPDIASILIGGAILLPILLIMSITSMFLMGSLTCSLYRQFLMLSKGNTIEIKDLFWALNHKKLRITAFISIFLYGLFIALWSILFIIPGIMAAFSYALTFFILAENPEMRPLEAIRTSKDMMRGHRRELFWLGCRFIGWSMVSLFTFGIGFLWYTPYYLTALTSFYETLKAESADYELAAIGNS